MYNPFRKAAIVEKDLEMINSKPLQKITPQEAREKINKIEKEKEQLKLQNRYSDSEVEKVWSDIVEQEIIRRTNNGDKTIGFLINSFPKNMEDQLIKYGKKLGWKTWLYSGDMLLISI